MINVLHVVSGLDSGGVESMLYSYYREMDHSEIHFDFLVHGNSNGMFAKKFRELGCDIYCLTPRSVSFLKNIRDMFHGMSKKKYDIVHSHIGVKSFLPLSIALCKGVKYRLAGAHCAIRNNLIENFMRLLTRMVANKYVACSELAAQVTFKKNKGNFFLLRNAVDVKKFAFDVDKRKKIRKEYGIPEDCILLGNVGRLVWEKNQAFLISLLQKLNNDTHKKYRLMIVGDGPLQQNLQILAKEKQVEGSIFFVKSNKDIEYFYNAFDYFVFPSTNEGFGIVAVEAQMNGLVVLASNTLSEELCLGPNYRILDVNNIDEWYNMLRENKYVFSETSRLNAPVERNDYDIRLLSKTLTDFYKKIF